MPLGDIAIWRARISILFQVCPKRSTVKSNSCYKSLFSNLLLNILFTLFILILFGDLLIYSVLLFGIHDMNWSFVFRSLKYFLSKKALRLLSVKLYIITLIHLYILLLSNDIEKNPGPRLFGNLSICFWNLNSIMAHNFQKISSIIAYNSIHKYDLICLGETYLNSSITSDNQDLIIDGYNIIRADHPSDTRRGGVCIYYKKSLPFRNLNTHFLSECIVCELDFDNKKCILIILYRSPSQTPFEFQNFLLNFENVLEFVRNINPLLCVVIGDFNAKSHSWYANDVTSIEGTEIEGLTSAFGFFQLISEPTHILPNSSTCIDLLFANQPNLIVNSGVHPSLHPQCHHQVIYAIIEFKIYFPPPYQRLVWDYSKADTEAIDSVIAHFDWATAFSTLNVDDQVHFFNDTIMNIFKNYIPSKVITINDRDPPWLTDQIKRKINLKNIRYHTYVRNGKNNNDYEDLCSLCEDVSLSIKNAKENYYNHLVDKINASKGNGKSYWTILKSLFIGKKVPVIPPLLVNGVTVTDFARKATLLNEKFSKQCTILDNSSTLPDFPVFHANNQIDSFMFSSLDITELISEELLKELEKTLTF